MFVLNADIQIGAFRFTRVHEVEIVSSTKVLEDTATLKLPTTARLERAGEYISEVEVAKTFKVGDAVTIRMGYNGALRDEFRGFVRKIRPNTPLEIECEDGIYQLKRGNLQKSFRSVTLRSLLEYILQGTGIGLIANVPSMTLAPFYLKNVSAAKVLQKLKEEYGLTIYLQTPTVLFVGVADENDSTVVKYRFGENIISNDLEWENEEDVKLQVKAVHVRRNNTIIEKTVGDPEGEKRTLFFYDLENESDLERRALEEVHRYRFTGYRGTIETFLLPNAKVGNVARIEDTQYQERSGDYLIESVTTTFGQSGARRKIELGLKVN